MIADAINQLGDRFDAHSVQKRCLRLHTVAFAQELASFERTQDPLQQFSAAFAKFVDTTFHDQIRKTNRVNSENLGGKESQNQEWEKLSRPIVASP